MKRFKKHIAILSIAFIILSLMPSSSIVYAAPPMTNPKFKDDSIDPDLKMVTGDEWKANYGKATGPGTRYTVKSFNSGLNFDDYMNDMNYMIRVEGYQFKKPVSQTEKGWMPLLRPLRDSDSGRLFFTDISYWTLQFNGDSAYVNALAKNYQNIIMDNTTKKEINRFYIRDLAKWTGAIVRVEGLNQFDSGFGFEGASANVQTTSYPDASLTVPSTAKTGDTITIGFTGEEFYPYSEYGLDPDIRYDLKVDGKSIDSGYKKAKTINSTKSYKFLKAGTYKIELEVMDRVSRKFSVSKTISVGDVLPPPPPVEYPNKPPIAEISTLPYYYWVETVDISTISYDQDGLIVSENWFVDGQPISGNTWKSSRVTQKTSHSAYFQNEDERGATGEAFASFDILPTTPTAKTTTTGTFKQNRAITFDAKASDYVSPVHVAPIDYSKTTWNIVPKSTGLTISDIKRRPSSDPSKYQALFKKPGTYELQVTVTNNYNETSDVYVQEIEIRPDEVPFASFTADKSVYLRNALDQKQATVTLTDTSASIDGDTIAQRIWYVEFDANNDGLFGTAADGGKQVLSSANLKTLVYKTKHVGHYRFSLDVKEAFGEPTFEEFILPSDYLKDTTDVIDSGGSVATYMKPENFNLPFSETAIKIDNVPPVIDFAIKRKNSIHLVLDFGGMDVPTLQRKTGTRPGNGTNNGGGGGQYDHYYYTIDETTKNRLTAHAGSLEADLRLKGLDAKVEIKNAYRRVFDIDGECVVNVPVWGWVDYGGYNYSSYSGSSPYSGSWEVVSQTETPTYGVVWCYEDKTAEGGRVNEHAPPCSNPANEQYGQTGTRYDASLRQYQSNYQYVVTHYENQGCGLDNRPGNPTSDMAGIDEQVDTTDFTTAFNALSFNNVPYKYYFRMDNNVWTWNGNSTIRNQVVNTIKTKNIFFWSNANNALRNNAQSLINSGGKEGRYTQYNTSSLQSNIQSIRDELLNSYMVDEDPQNFTIVLGDELDYTTVYDDYEVDPELQREWKFIHNPTIVNGRVINAQPSGPIAQSGLYINSPMQLTEVGEYTVSLRAKDNPLSNTGNDARFAEYRKWSDEEVVREYKVNVHRRPIADFKANVEAGSLKLTLDPSDSFDPDHQYNWGMLGLPSNGITEVTWEKYVLDEAEYGGPPPTNLVPNKDYYITLRVKDIDGAYGFITKLVSTKNVNLRPIALFDSPSVVNRTDSLNTPSLNTYIRDRSYDPNGDALTNYTWTVKRQSDGVVVWTSATAPTNFQAMGIPNGSYLIGLRLWDVPKYPPTLQSDLYEKEIIVTNNTPPNSCFELSRTVISQSSITCTDGMTSPHTIHVDETAIYTDKSTDPDGHSLINYSWTVEKLDASNNVLKTWNTGSAPVDFSLFDGVGKYRVSQTVFDNPPSPLPSLSGKHSRIFNVIKGPQAPYAMFDYSPLLPIQGDTISLKDRSIDEDGTVVQWEWSIVSPSGSTTVQTTQNPVIMNAQIGTYKITLNVWDNTAPTRLKSKVAAYKEIIVTPAPPNLAPVPFITWDPFKPYLGDTFNLNPDASYDLDGTIVSYTWSIKSKEGAITTSTNRYPSMVASSAYFDVTLTIRDDDGATASVTQRITIDIAKLTPLVTHTDEWKDYWTSEGFNEDVNSFLAGEKFVIRLLTTPANSVFGSVNFGGDIGNVQIPKTDFRLVRTSQYEYEWEAILWREDFDQIKVGEYAFEFTGNHPVTSPNVTSNGVYMISVVKSIYDAFKYHQSY